jgi:hypothetical protein
MFGPKLMQYFVETAGTWLCDGYALDIRYIASKNGDELHLIEAAIRLLPVQHTVDLGFQLQVLNFEAGQFQRFPKSKTELLKILSDAVDGTITVHGQVLKLAGQGQRGYYSEMNHPDRWFYPLHIQALGESVTAMQQDSQFALDCTRRTASPPFDGLADLIAWLGLNPDLSGTQS